MEPIPLCHLAKTQLTIMIITVTVHSLQLEQPSELSTDNNDNNNMHRALNNADIEHDDTVSSESMLSVGLDPDTNEPAEFFAISHACKATSSKNIDRRLKNSDT